MRRARAMPPNAPNTLDIKSMLFGALALAIVVNVAQFWSVNARTRKNYRSFAHYPNADLVAIDGHERSLFRRHHQRALEFREAISPGATLVFPADRELVDDELAQQLLSYGRARELRRVPYDPSVLGKSVRTTKHVLAKVKAKKRRAREFLVVARGRDAREFALLRRNETDMLIEIALLPKAIRSEVSP